MPVNISGNGLFTGASSINGLTLPTDSFSPGLVKITDQMFSAVSSVSVNNCFTSTYDNYRIVVQAKADADRGFTLRFRASGSDKTDANYQWERLTALSTTVAASLNTSQTSFVSFAALTSADSGLILDVINPALSTAHSIIQTMNYYPVSGAGLYTSVGAYAVASTVDGFTLYPSAGNFTGTVRVYGYRN